MVACRSLSALQNRLQRSQQLRQGWQALWWLDHPEQFELPLPTMLQEGPLQCHRLLMLEEKRLLGMTLHLLLSPEFRMQTRPGAMACRTGPLPTLSCMLPHVSSTETPRTQLAAWCYLATLHPLSVALIHRGLPQYVLSVKRGIKLLQFDTHRRSSTLTTRLFASRERTER